MHSCEVNADSKVNVAYVSCYLLVDHIRSLKALLDYEDETLEQLEQDFTVRTSVHLAYVENERFLYLDVSHTDIDFLIDFR